MRIIHYSDNQTGKTNIGILLDDGVMNFTEAYQALQLFDNGSCACPYHSPIELMKAGLFTVDIFKSVIDFTENHRMSDRFRVSDYTLLAPITNPSKILALGRNYLEHAKELGNYIPKEPVFFSKLPSSVVGPNESVIYKKFLTRVDPEIELAVIIGKQGANIPEADVWDYIAGYTILNDVTARDMQAEDFKTASPWTRSKGIDTFCPIGPCITLPDEITPPIELNLELRVNGDVRQKSNTRNFIFSIPTAISYIAQYHTLYPGDIIPTGTPEGIAPVQPGDVMECIVEMIGILSNPVVAEG
jgi:2-keto-4-pentenoate hydratase/2-oxohepta-3-ene-1,7-dioic acid hydratase in catechol pathway